MLPRVYKRRHPNVVNNPNKEKELSMFPKRGKKMGSAEVITRIFP